MRLGWRGKTAYFLALLLGGLLSTAVSYGVVRYFAQELRQGPAPDADVREAEQLRQFSNTLLRLTGEYLSNLSRRGGGHAPGLRTWAAHDFRPGLNDLRRQMARSPVSAQPLTALLAAADRLALMVADPEDAQLRRAALDEVRSASDAVEAYIAAQRLDSYLTQPRAMPAF